MLPTPHAHHHKDLPYRQHLSAQIEFTKTVLQLSTQKQSAMDVVKNTVRTRGVLGLYKVARRAASPNPDTNSNPDANDETGALPGAGPIL